MLYSRPPLRSVLHLKPAASKACAHGYQMETAVLGSMAKSHSTAKSQTAYLFLCFFRCCVCLRHTAVKTSYACEEFHCVCKSNFFFSIIKMQVEMSCQCQCLSILEKTKTCSGASQSNVRTSCQDQLCNYFRFRDVMASLGMHVPLRMLFPYLFFFWSNNWSTTVCILSGGPPSNIFCQMPRYIVRTVSAAPCSTSHNTITTETRKIKT